MQLFVDLSQFRSTNSMSTTKLVSVLFFVLFLDALNTFYLRLYGIKHGIKVPLR